LDSFGRIGAFQWVTANPNKKIRSLFQPRRRIVSSRLLSGDQAGTTCWHSVERYDYPPNANVVVHPYDWQWDSGANYAWREHTGRGYWQGDQWTPF
jgi:hypothetical protein